MNRRTTLRSIATLFVLIVVISGCSPSYHGSTINPATPAADIHMPDQNGIDFQLTAQQGKVVLLFFGFLNCMDECPLTMAHLSQALNIVGEPAQNVQVVMVSTDPVRDNPKAMKEYLANFNPSFLGITGNVEQLKPIWNDYGVVVLDGGETHSAYTYVIDQNGDLRLTFDPEMTPDEIAADLETLLKQ